METKETKSLQERAIEAAARCLKHKSYEIVGTNYNDVDIIAKQDDTLVFIRVAVRRGQMPKECWNKQQAESAAFNYMCEYEIEDKQAIRFDYISLMVNSNDRALLRHHINCLEGNEAA